MAFVAPVATLSSPRPQYRPPNVNPGVVRAITKALKNNHLGLALRLLSENPLVKLPDIIIQELAGKLRTRGLPAPASLGERSFNSAFQLLSTRKEYAVSSTQLRDKIREYAEKSRLEDALMLIRESPKSEVDISSLELLMKVAAEQTHIKHASYILYTLFPQYGFGPTAIAMRYFVHACGKAGNIRRAISCTEHPNFQILSRDDKSYVYSALIDTCVKLRNGDMAYKLLGWMKARNIPRNENIYVSLLSVSSNKRNVNSLRILKDMERDGFSLRQLSTYNAIILGFSRLGYMRDAMTVFNRMRASKVRPNLDTFNALLKCCVRAVSPDKSFKILEYMHEYHVEPNAVSYNWIVAACARAAEVDKAFEVAQQMKEEGIKLNIVTNNNLLEACCNAGRLEQAYAMVKEMIQKQGVQPNSYTYNILIRGCGRWGQLDAALRLLQSMQAAGISPTVITYSIAIDACARAGAYAMDKAFEIINEMQKAGVEPNLVTYNSLIHVCASSKRMNKAFSVFEQMHEVGVQPDVVTLCTLVDACGRSGDVDRAFQCLTDIPKQFPYLRLNVPVYNALIQACFKASDLNRMHEALEDMKKKRLRPNVVTYSTIITAYSTAGSMKEAVSCLSEMTDMGIRPNRMTFTSIISGFGRLGKVDLAMNMLEQAKQYCGEPDEELYTSAIVAAIVGGRKERATSIAAEMTRAGYSLPTILNGLVRKVGDIERSAAEIRDMIAAMEALNIRPRRVALESLIDAYAREADVAAAFSVLPDMRRLGYLPNFRNYKQLIQACASSGSKSDILRARALFRKLRYALHTYEPRLYSRHWKDLNEALIRALEKDPFSKDGVDLRIAALRSMADDFGEESAREFAMVACPHLADKF